MTATMTYETHGPKLTVTSNSTASTLAYDTNQTVDRALRTSVIEAEAKRRADIDDRREAEAEADVAGGRTARFENAADLLADLDDDL